MTYNKETKQKQIKLARMVLDWFEKHELGLPDIFSFSGASFAVNTWVMESDGGRQVLTDIVKACLLDKIPIQKEYRETDFSIRFLIEEQSVTFSCARDLVCEAIETGETRIVPGYTIPAREEKVIRWECKDSLLKVDND